jgi:hypothetical protein
VALAAAAAAAVEILAAATPWAEKATHGLKATFLAWGLALSPAAFDRQADQKVWATCSAANAGEARHIISMARQGTCHLSPSLRRPQRLA